MERLGDEHDCHRHIWLKLTQLNESTLILSSRLNTGANDSANDRAVDLVVNRSVAG